VSARVDPRLLALFNSTTGGSPRDPKFDPTVALPASLLAANRRPITSEKL
jgi:hypothetical protein